MGSVFVGSMETAARMLQEALPNPDPAADLHRIAHEAVLKLARRLLTDADMVVAIGCYRGSETWAYRGVYGGLYPTFSDTETLQRFRNAHLLDCDSVSKKEIDEIRKMIDRQNKK